MSASEESREYFREAEDASESDETDPLHRKPPFGDWTVGKARREGLWDA